MMLTQLCIFINGYTREFFRYDQDLAKLDLIDYFYTGFLNSSGISLDLGYSFRTQDITNATF